MDIVAFRARITIQKKETITDRYGNHLSVWNKWFSCWVYASDQTGQEEEAAAVVQNMKDRFDAVASKAQDSGMTVYFESTPL